MALLESNVDNRVGCIQIRRVYRDLATQRVNGDSFDFQVARKGNKRAILRGQSTTRESICGIKRPENPCIEVAETPDNL